MRIQHNKVLRNLCRSSHYIRLAKSGSGRRLGHVVGMERIEIYKKNSVGTTEMKRPLGRTDEDRRIILKRILRQEIRRGGLG